MTEMEAREALLVYLKTQAQRYDWPRVMENPYWPPMRHAIPLRYPVVEVFDNDTGNCCIFACVTRAEDVEDALSFAAYFAQQLGEGDARIDLEPLEIDYAIWIGEVVRP